MERPRDDQVSVGPLSALCVDYFDTLASHRQQLPRLGDLLGMPEAFESVWRAWGDRRMREHVTFESLLEEVFRVARHRPEEKVVAEVIAERARRQSRLLLEPDDRILAMLRACRDMGLRIAVVSNAACEDLASWHESAFASLVDATVSSWEVGAVKPEPQIYLAALDRLDVRADQTAFVSDAISDLDGARSVGFRELVHATWYRHAPLEEHSYAVVDDPARLSGLLAASDHESMARAAYDITADAYAESIGTELTSATEGPLDRAFLHAFVEFVADTAKPVADVGCGPGRVAAFLKAQGLDVLGVDVSPAMLAVARNAHTTVEFKEGSLTNLPVPERSLAGAVCWYSIIHTPPEQLGAVSKELARALTHDGYLLVAFPAGAGEAIHRSEAYGRTVSLTSHRHAPDYVVACLAAAGFRIHARAVREPEFAHESTPQAFILARAPDPQE